jgi:hypothetical protein
MEESVHVQRRKQFCARCGQLMFEYFRSPDGHFGLVNDLPQSDGAPPGRGPDQGWRPDAFRAAGEI